MRQLYRTAAVVTLALSRTTEAWPCPLCDTGAGRRVRAGIFGPDFGDHLLVTLLPFPIFLGVVALIHFGPPWARGRDRQDGKPGAGPETPPRPTAEEPPWTPR